MGIVYQQEIRDEIVKLRNDGLTYPQIAEKLGIEHSSSLWRICNTGGKLKNYFATDEDRNKIIEMFNNGASRHEIADMIGRSYTFVTHYLAKNGLSHKEKQNKLHAKMREYKAQGHTLKEVEEHFGVKSASQICKGIAPQKCDYAEVSNKLKDKYIPIIHEQTAERLKTLLCDEFEWVGGYTCSTGYVTIRCKQCGTEFERSAQAIRKQQVKCCPRCKKEETERNVAQRELEREERRVKREAQEEIQRRERERKRQEAEQRRIENTVTKVCRMCGNEFETTNKQKVCCSPECSKRYANNHNNKRISKKQRIDKGINALSLFKRDKGVCWICGGQCDMNDYITKNGYFVAGDWYPSVDHIVPICEGGADAWANVKLAHRICNTRRYLGSRRSENV